MPLTPVILPADTITTFRGDYRFLSNFFFLDAFIFWIIPSQPVYVTRADATERPAPTPTETYRCVTVEHGYQLSKTLDRQWQYKIANAQTAGVAKQLGRQCPIRPDWEQIKIPTMQRLLELKFDDRNLRRRLLATAPHQLVEGNDWNDRFWGMTRLPAVKGSPVYWVGENWLGRLLMEIRDGYEPTD